MIQPIPGKNTQPDPKVAAMVSAAAEYDDIRPRESESPMKKSKLPEYSKDPLEYYNVLSFIDPAELVDQWVPCSEDKYYEMLGCLPPARFSHNCFMVGEPLCESWTKRHTIQGTYFEAFVMLADGSCWHRPALLHKFNPSEYKHQIQAQTNH